MHTHDLDTLLDRASRRRGWAFVSDPPARVALDGGCVLCVIPAWLWRSRPALEQCPDDQIADVVQLADRMAR